MLCIDFGDQLDELKKLFCFGPGEILKLIEISQFIQDISASNFEAVFK